MDFPRLVLVRTQLAIAAALLAGAGLAGVSHAQDDRDGLTQTDDQRAAYHGPLLSWAGKTTPHAPPPRASRAPPPAEYAPMRYQSHRSSDADAKPPRRPMRAPPRADYADEPPPFQPPQRQAPPRADYADEPAPQPQFRPQRSAPPPPQPQSLAQSGRTASASSEDGTTPVRFYSLHRAYGLTPDPIEMPERRPMVLIGPPDHASAPSQDDNDASDDGDKPAAKPDQDGDDKGGHGADLSNGVGG
jgi:hypothetical protein